MSYPYLEFSALANLEPISLDSIRLVFMLFCFFALWGGMTKTKFDPSKIQSCLWCGSSNRSAISRRLDGMPILQCQSCGHFAVQSVPINLDELYQCEDYYHADGTTGLGYQDYSSLPLINWSVEILGSLMLVEGRSDKSSLSLLDIGCATGNYLDFFKEFGWQTNGADLSAYAKDVCRDKGHSIVELVDFEYERKHSYEVVTAFHVIEHLTEFSSFFTVVNGLIDNGAQFFFVVPGVDFSEPVWNGFDSSYEHISYFDHKFVKDNFASKIHSLGAVLSMGSLVCGFAGSFSAEVKLVLMLLVDIASSRAIERSHREQLAGVTALQIAFMASFLARACSASLALELLEVVQASAGRSDWLAFARALAYLQNNNCYGGAAALGQMKESAGELKFLRERGVAELLPTLKRSNSKAFPLVTVVSLCNGERPLPEEFFLSAGMQTYPNINMVHLQVGSSCACGIPEYYDDLIERRDCTEVSLLEKLLNASFIEPGSLLLLCDGRAALSKYCLFALQHCLVEQMYQFAVPTFDAGRALPSWLPGRRTIHHTLQRFFPPQAAAVMFRHDSLSYLVDLLVDERYPTPEKIIRSVPSHLVVNSTDLLGSLLS